MSPNSLKFSFSVLDLSHCCAITGLKHAELCEKVVLRLSLEAVLGDVDSTLALSLLALSRLITGLLLDVTSSDLPLLSRV